MESKLVNDEFVSRKDTYNLKVGGYGGFDHLNDGSEEHIKRCRKAGNNPNSKNALRKGIATQIQLSANDNEWKAKKVEKCKNTLKEIFADGYRGGFSGKSHTQEAKDRIGKANAKRKGTDNSQFGTIWIYNLNEKISKKVKKEELRIWEDKGWHKGRKIKF